MTSANGYTFKSSRLRTLLCCVLALLLFQIYPVGIFYIERGGAIREEEEVDGKRIYKAREN